MGGGKIIIPLFIIGKIGMQLLPNYFQIFTALEYAMFFWIGCMIRKYLPNISTKNLLIVGGILLIVNLTSFYFTESFTGNSSLSAKILHMSFDILSKISGSTMAFFLLNLIGRSINWNNTLFNQLSLMSFPIYLLHQQIIYVLLWNFHGLISPYLLVLINFIGSILLSSFLSNLLMRTKYGRVIIGMK